MDRDEVIRETLNRLYVSRQCKPLYGNITREEIWLESIVRVLLGIPEGVEIPLDLGMLKQPDIVSALLNKTRDNLV